MGRGKHENIATHWPHVHGAAASAGAWLRAKVLEISAALLAKPLTKNVANSFTYKNGVSSIETYAGLAEPIFHARVGMVVAVFTLSNFVQLKHAFHNTSTESILLQHAVVLLISLRKTSIFTKTTHRDMDGTCLVDYKVPVHFKAFSLKNSRPIPGSQFTIYQYIMLLT